MRFTTNVNGYMETWRVTNCPVCGKSQRHEDTDALFVCSRECERLYYEAKRAARAAEPKREGK